MGYVALHKELDNRALVLETEKNHKVTKMYKLGLGTFMQS